MRFLSCYAGVCKGRVFLASEKFNPVRECGPGFRKNLRLFFINRPMGKENKYDLR